MSAPPWELLLPPKEGGSPLLVLGRVDAAAREALAGRVVHHELGQGPFAAALLLPGGPAPTEAEVSRLGRHLVPGAPLLWWLPHSRGPVPVTRTGPRWLAAGRSLWRPDAAWAEPLPSSDKRDWIRGVLGRAGRATHELGCVSPDAASSDAWLSQALERIAQQGGPRLATADVGRIDRTPTGLAIARLIGPRHRVLALKVASDERSRSKLLAESRVLAALRARRLASAVSSALPEVLAAGDHAGNAYRLESWIPGESGSRLMYRPGAREPVVDVALDWIVELHRTGSDKVLSPGEQARRTREVLARVAGLTGIADEGSSSDVASYVDQALRRDPVRAVQGHGDFWLGNLIVDPSRRSLAGAIDWNWADAEAPPLEDALHLLLYRKGLLSTYAPCKHLALLLEGRGARCDRRRLGRYARSLELPPRALGALALVYWARYLDTRSEYLGELREDFARAYVPVRRAFERLGPRALDDWGAGLVLD